MQAVRLYGKQDVRIIDVHKPVPKAGEILVRIAAAGVVEPFALGHDNAGWVEELGEGDPGFSRGDPVLVFDPWGGGHCHPCQTSAENYCDHRSEIAGYGGCLGLDGVKAQSLPYGRSLSIHDRVSRTEMMEVIQLSARGIIHVEAQEFPMTQAFDVYRRLEQGKIMGRSVLIP